MRLAVPARPAVPSPRVTPHAPTLDAAALEEVARAAAGAVQLLPGRPWRLAAGPDGLEVSVDRRSAAAGAADERLLDLAGGAAVHAMREALRRMGAEPVVRLLPRTADPALLATLRIAGPALHRAAAPGGPPAAPAPTADLLRLLREEAALEGVALELRSSSDRLPLLAAVGTATDTRPDRLRAGLALQRIVEAAAANGLRAFPLTRPWERPESAPCAGGHAQLLLQLRRASAG